MKKNINYISALSVISAISVVILHTNGIFWTFSKSRYWITANVIECIFYFAVPIFFMISGATLINFYDKYDLKTFFKKRIKKTLIPFIFWNIIAVFFVVYVNHFDIRSLKFSEMLNRFFNTQYISIYWFFPALFSVYLSIPLFAAVEKEKRVQIFKYLIIVSLLLNNFIPFINNTLELGITIPVSVSVGSNYLIYIMLGYILNELDLDKQKRYTIYILGILGLLLHIVGTYYLSVNAGYIIKTYKGYCNIPCIFYSISIFVLIKQLFNKFKFVKINKVINIIAPYTFAIYLMHWYVMEIITRLFDFNRMSIYYRLGMPFLIIPICTLIAYILRKFKILKNIVP